MQPTMCSRCGKNVAVIFITKLEGGSSKNEGLCLKCAREIGIKPIDDMMKKMGISDEDLDNLTSEMMSAFGGAEGLEGMMSPAKDEDDEEDDGRTATFPFLNQLFGGSSSSPEKPASGEGSTPPPRSEKGQAKPAKRKFLDSYCISLTQRAQEGKLDKLIGRERELERVIQILNRRQKNNPCLIGEPGVGKTAIAEGLAQRIANKDVPYKLLEKEVYLLDLTSLVAGTQFRGQFESRMKGLIEEIRKLGNIILVIDEVHTIVGAGDAEGSMNAANILKPALSRGEVQVIGATTLNEYRKHIEKDTALERRFQPIIVKEPSIEDSVKVIEGIVPYYESFHQVEVSPAMCRLAVTMSERYITDRYLPDKAIDLIDEACSNVNLHNKALARLNAVNKELADLAKEKEVMMAAGTEESYERLAAIKSMELRLEEEKSGLENEAHPSLTQEHLANVIELWTNIPASRIQEQEFQRLAKLEERLEEHVIGQDEAVKAVSAAIRRGRVGISPKRKPVSFIFVGSTGVGKTELVKQLAADLFDSPEALIRLDMSEFMEKHAVSRIIGSPPGYVGYDEAGQLTEKIRRKPYSVVLFDEIEKAHPDVLNILLQILDDGRVTDAHGRTVNFENTVIVMTTNAGSNTKVGSVGFGRTANEQGKDRAMKALNDFLRPEFINRVDEIVYFNQLSEDNFKGIAVLMLKELVGTLKEKEINFTWDETLLNYLVKKSYSATYGARNLRRLIQKELEDAIAVRLIEGWREPVSQLKAVSNGDELELLAM
ncbi:ATP-dependent Clp protease ATP-binding subunit ClpX [Firmicutes bacterium ASF500]|nr:ATP-dependent Clp protease ATP-binding subunit ClpX [Firmicutes bacterium ASF500]